MCSREEIERKRLAAIQKRQNKIFSSSNRIGEVSFDQSHAGPVRNISGNLHKTLQPYTKSSPSKPPEVSVPISKVVTGTVYLLSEDRFEVNPSEFCAPLINIFKSIASRTYDAKTKLWNFSIEDYQEFMCKVAPLAPHVVLGNLPSFVLKVLKEPTINPDMIDLTPVEVTLRRKLMPFQEEGVRFGIARRGRCMIADDMGLGKTFQALGIASYYRHNWPLLIVTTSSMRETWQSKIHELLPTVPLVNIATLTTGKDTQLVADKQTEVVIVSYKITGMHTELLKNKKFGVVIIDESHHLKSHKAQCTIALSSITRYCQRVILLSGTPALSRPSELYTQLTLIEPRLFTSYTEYGKRYCDGKQTNFGWDMSGQSNLPELQIILQKRFLIRRTKEQVLTKLEEKTRETVLLDRTLLQYTKEEERGLSQMAEAYKTTKTDKHTALVTYFSESAKVKIPAICKYIKQLLGDNTSGKFLVFAHHRNVIEAICVTLDEAGVHYICIVGSTPTNTRADLVEKFQHTESCRCAVLSITAASSGLTLTAADLVLFAELHWNPGVLNDVGLCGDTFEDARMRHQESKTNIVNYLTQPLKNKSDYIPGTNIRKDRRNAGTNGLTNENRRDHLVNECDVVDKSFLEDDEGDELLASLNL